MPQNERNQKVFSVKVYDKKHLSNLNKRMKRVQQLLDAAVGRAVGIASKTGYEDLSEDFRFDDFPQARREIDALLGELSTSLTLNVESANSEAWGLANRKNDAMADSMLEETGVELPRKATRKWYNKNERALNAFQRRVSDGMNLSSNVWNLAQFKGELELSLEMELGRGKSAAEISRDVRSFLKYPNKLFRRVRDEKGVLRLSRAAREFHPGQGVYRSSYKNALRLTATETNMAYRTADNMRWNQMDFVLGQHIEPSKTNHPVVDICDELKGDYPKDFKFVGWHPFCKCFSVPKLASKEEFIKYQQAILDGEDVSDWKFDGEVKDVPGNFKDWMQDNEQRVKYHNTVPYFIKDNTKYVPNSFIDGIGTLRKDSDSGFLTDLKDTILKLKDPTYITEKEVRTMIMDFESTNPTLFNGGLKAVKVTRAKNVNSFMSNYRDYYTQTGTYAAANGNTIKITDKDFTLKNGVVFNPLHEIKSAMRAISENRKMTFNEEYAIESLWHEIRHSAAKGWNDVRKKTDHLTEIMECVNQFCARRTYGNFLRAIGGKPANFKDIVEQGYGYSGIVRNFGKLLDSCNISRSSAHSYLRDRIINTPYEDIKEEVVELLINRGGLKRKKAEDLLKGLRLSEAAFDKLLRGV